MSTATKSAKRSTPLVVGDKSNQQHRTKRPAPTKGGFFDARTQDLLRQKHQKKDHKSRENARIFAVNGASGKKKHQNTKTPKEVLRQVHQNNQKKSSFF